jgi:hypothetical protein
MERADESFFPNTPITLTRKNIDDKREVSYFNIDVLCEQMETYNTLYANKNGLYKALLKQKNNITLKEEIFKTEESQQSGRDKDNEIVLNKHQECINKVIEMQGNHDLNDAALDDKIRQSKKIEAELYQRVKAHYQYYDIQFLTEALKKIAGENKKSYRNLNNALSFRALDDNHPLKLQVYQAFKIKEKYSSEYIEGALTTIIKDQFFKTLKPIDSQPSRSRLVNHFNSFIDSTYTGGKYLIKGYGHKEIPEPMNKIPKEAPAINFFEI